MCNVLYVFLASVDELLVDSSQLLDVMVRLVFLQQVHDKGPLGFVFHFHVKVAAFKQSCLGMICKGHIGRKLKKSTKRLMKNNCTTLV